MRTYTVNQDTSSLRHSHSHWANCQHHPQHAIAQTTVAQRWGQHHVVQGQVQHRALHWARHRVQHCVQHRVQQWMVYFFFLVCATLATTLPSVSQASLFGDGKPENASFDSPFEDRFLPVDEAFQFSHRIQQGGPLDGQLIVQWNIEPEYYLYKKRFKFESAEEEHQVHSEKYIQSPVSVDDPEFGLVDVFKGLIEIHVPFSKLGSDPFELTVKYQGCAEAGLCYPPQKRKILLDPNQLVALNAAENSTDLAVSETTPSTQALSQTTSPETAKKVEEKETEKETNNTPAEKSDLETNDDYIDFLNNAGILTIVGMFFLLGLGLTFTPCVFPMIPILSGIIAGQDKEHLTPVKAFLLSLTYVLGMAITYSIAGVIVGVWGAEFNIQIYLQTPAVLITFAIVFVLLSLSMFGFYELQLPQSLQSRLNDYNRKQQGGTYIGVFIMGALSALIVSPCVSAPLAGTLIYISTTGDGFLGGFALFAMGMGMGFPLLVIGTSGGKLLPKAGVWMLAVKAFFGVMLLAVAIWLLERILPASITLILWALLVGVSAVHMGALEPTPNGGWPRFWKGVGLMLLVWSILMLIGAASGGSDPLKPIAFSSPSSTSMEGSHGAKAHVDFKFINNSEQLQTALTTAKQSQQLTALDFYADWCAECKVMEKHTFSNATVVKATVDIQWLQVDMTDFNEEHKALLNQFGLSGPPSVLFFHPEGYEISKGRVQGDMPPEKFISHIDKYVRSAL